MNLSHLSGLNIFELVTVIDLSRGGVVEAGGGGGENLGSTEGRNPDITVSCEMEIQRGRQSTVSKKEKLKLFIIFGV